MEWVEAIRTAISYVEDHLDDDQLTTETVADAVHISSFHFQRGTREENGYRAKLYGE